jgi:hypothetical protein
MSLNELPFMVVDAGGGTVDITIHKMMTDGKLAEIHQPSGGSWGSTTVNAEFEKMLKTLFGTEFTNAMQNTDLWFSVMDSFEVLGGTILTDQFSRQHNIPQLKTLTFRLCRIGLLPHLNTLSFFK